MPRRDAATRRGEVDTKKRGRRTHLTPERADKIVEVVETGNHITTACHAAGVHTATLYRWIERGDRLDYAIEHGEPFDPDDLIYRDFRDRLMAARARATVKAVDVIDRAMTGGFVIEEEPILDGSGNPVRDDDGSIAYRRKYASPDGRLALSFLARMAPEQWGRAPETTRLELVQPDDETPGRSGVPEPDAVARLASRLAQVKAEQVERDADERGLPAADAGPEDPVDAELVEDDDAEYDGEDET